MHRLINIGFVLVGHWKLRNDAIKFELATDHKRRNLLYTFLSNGEIKYIGKTTMYLTQRMYGYQNPGPMQTTNIRLNEKLKNLLVGEQPVDIFILEDNDSLKYGDFGVSLSAGLEDSLISQILPEWNITGTKRIPVDIESETPELTKDPKPTESLTPVLAQFEITIGSAYFNQGFFNVGVEYDGMVGANRSLIDIQLGLNEENSIHGYINRTAQPNATARIMGGAALRDWIRENFEQSKKMKVDLISPTSLRLYR